MEKENVLYRKRKGSKSFTIKLSGDSSVVVSLPYRMPLTLAKILFKKYAKEVEKMKEKEQKRRIFLKERYSLAKELFQVHSKEQREKYKKEAYLFVMKALPKIALPEMVWNRISIKNTKTRWGSCSSKGNLAFHYKILFLPEKLTHYLLSHELCHLEEMNHGPRFWSLVGTLCPEYEELRLALKSIPTS